jgi:hypothetical protein
LKAEIERLKNGYLERLDEKENEIISINNLLENLKIQVNIFRFIF